MKNHCPYAFHHSFPSASGRIQRYTWRTCDPRSPTLRGDCSGQCGRVAGGDERWSGLAGPWGAEEAASCSPSCLPCLPLWSLVVSSLQRTPHSLGPACFEGNVQAWEPVR